MVQLLLKNAHYYSQGGFQAGDIYIENGIISAITAAGACPEATAERVLNLQGLTVLPGIIDAHTHMREPGYETREDFFSGSCAAAAGGVTTYCDMPSVIPPPYSLSTLQERIRLAEQKSVVDFAMYGAAGFENRLDLQELADSGIIAFKTFLHPRPNNGTEEFRGLTVADDGELYLLLQEGAKTGQRFFFHAENNQLMKALERELHRRGEEGFDFHYRSRPNAAESSSVAVILQFARETGCAVGFVHISTPEAAELIRQAQAEGLDVIAETCYQYLIFDHSLIDACGPYAKCNPPLRSAADRAQLWEYLWDGTLSMVSSDHAPHDPAAKERGLTEGIWNAPSGIAGVEMLLPMMLRQVAEDKLALTELAQLLSENVAIQHGLFPQKGCIAVGSDADFTILDMDDSYPVKTAEMQTKARACNQIFEGLEIPGSIQYTIVRGRVVLEEGRVDVSARGHGRYAAAWRQA